jgi:hypothetical protein
VSRTGLVIVALFVVALGVFRASPRGQLYDSRYTLLVAHRLLTTGDPALDPFVDQLGGVDATGAPRDYRLVETGDHVHWLYPLGTPLLAAPFVAAARPFGISVVDEHGRFDRSTERRMQRWLAAGAMALAGVLFYATARAWLAVRPSALIALAALFASPVWSTTSRSLWSQTAALLLASGAACLIVTGVGRGASIRPVAIATLLAWACSCRPTAVIPAALVTVWVAVRRPAEWPKLAATGAAWAALFAAGSTFVYGSVLPPYFRLSTHAFRVMPEALIGNWLSPARGLLVYCPVLALVGMRLVRRWRGLPDRSLAVLALGVVALHWVVISSHAPWWGGYGYGPRLMADTVPWLVVLATLAFAAPAPEARRGPAARAPRAAAALTAALVVVGAGLHGVGAIARSAADWNHHQAEPDFADRLWRWDDAPFLAPFGAPAR